MHNSSIDDRKNTNGDEDKFKKDNISINEDIYSLEETESQLIEKDKKNRFTFALEKNKINLDELANSIFFITVFIGIWQLIYLIGIWPKISLPSPLMVAEAFYELFQNNMLLLSIGTTMYRLAVGFIISIVIGMAVGLAMVKFPGFGKTMGSFAVGLQPSQYCLGSVCNFTYRA